jgi:hypothetical protein
MRLALFASPLLLVACTSAPDTSTGSLTKASDLQFQCDDSAHSSSFACGVSMTFAGDQVTATGLYADQTTGGPGAVATLTPAAADELADLIASLPLSTPEMIHSADCGGAPLRSTQFSIQFDNGEARNYTFEYGSGPAQDLNDFVIDLRGQIDACSGTSVTFASCTPNIAPN